MGELVLATCSGGPATETMRLAIHLQREIARLHFYDPGQSSRQIARTLGMSPNTVGDLREKLRSTGQDWAHLSELDDDQWCDAIGTTDRSLAQRKPAPDWAHVHAEMQRPDATLEQLWREWREVEPNGIAYTQFTANYRVYCKSLHVVMRRSHAPGHVLFTDYAGRSVEVRDAEGGATIKAQVFVAVLGYSNFTFLYATPTQTTSDWMECHIRCFPALGGVPQWVVSDNLKAAVWRRERDQIVLNPAYRDCLRHYDTAARPAGAYKPKHKAKAEVGVQIAQRWALFRLRDRVFFSMDELNQELHRLCAELNERPFKRLPGCRRSRFEQGESAALKPLPTQPYELCDWRYQIKVGDDHHVEHQRCYYSVPHHLKATRVDLRATKTTIEVYHRGRRVAFHPLLSTAGEMSTVPEHRPIAHQRVLEGEPAALLAWAQTNGPATLGMIRHHIEGRRDTTNGLLAARRIRNLTREHGELRIEEVCAYALKRNIVALRSLQSILKTSADKRPGQQEPMIPRAAHSNVRGPDYYGEQA